MHKGLKEPHLFNAASNPLKMIRNLAGILADSELDKIRKEIDANVIGLYRLGEAHFRFAAAVDEGEWRQKISRYYYAAYNVRRAVALKHDGTYSSDSSDHQKVDQIPDTLSNSALYRVKLKNLRDDRNLADYSHLANENDLLISIAEAKTVVSQLLNDAKKFLSENGITI
ncbi:hypothetical protein [Caballeronia ptereochthonis]|uniref:HEPN domain-containing protein n=1 Tax=Caballeronia ptereochthonis TaxID=1777144 RepID=A0A158CT68_9BURK|nr:hypothetical protein [Caballeronia ptereochthonis]SAK85585.1 hypothetical protein AWB83_04658 [Caballeronia ptereochthonis]